MIKRHHIGALSDMLDLSEDEFRRMLPDLCVWYAFAKPLHSIPGVKNTGFLWVDDGKNDVTGALVTDPNTGEVTEVKL